LYACDFGAEWVGGREDSEGDVGEEGGGEVRHCGLVMRCFGRLTDCRALDSIREGKRMMEAKYAIIRNEVR
jgi:hypothetical protein